jgi:transcriptional pleiotropic regulator of transition state genes
MKSTGIVRKIDELGRIVLPMELRRTLNIDTKDALEIYTEDEKIILKKYEPSNACMVTGEIHNDNIKLADGKLIISRDVAKQIVEEINKKLLQTV